MCSAAPDRAAVRVMLQPRPAFALKPRMVVSYGHGPPLHTLPLT